MRYPLELVPGGAARSFPGDSPRVQEKHPCSPEVREETSVLVLGKCTFFVAGIVLAALSKRKNTEDDLERWLVVP
jgi:hypothetical protein